MTCSAQIQSGKTVYDVVKRLNTDGRAPTRKELMLYVEPIFNLLGRQMSTAQFTLDCMLRAGMIQKNGKVYEIASGFSLKSFCEEVDRNVAKKTIITYYTAPESLVTVDNAENAD